MGATPKNDAPAEQDAVLALQRGASPLLISVPHAGTNLLPGLAERLTPAARALPDTDWHVEKLYAFATRLDVSLLQARLSRYVIDLNRDPSGASLYPGQRVTELCARTTFADEPLYVEGTAPTAAEEAERLQTCFVPYHETLSRELSRIKAQHGYAILLDAHSIRAEVPRFFEGRLPDLNLGTADGTTAAPDVQRVAETALATSGLPWVANGRFKGGYITRHFGKPDEGVHAIQLEIAQACYMDEAPPYRYAAALAEPLIAVLERLVTALLEVRPPPTAGAGA